MRKSLLNRDNEERGRNNDLNKFSTIPGSKGETVTPAAPTGSQDNNTTPLQGNEGNIGSEGDPKDRRTTVENLMKILTDHVESRNNLIGEYQVVFEGIIEYYEIILRNNSTMTPAFF